MAGEQPVSAPWYAVYIKHQHEKTAANLLEKKEFEVFLPVYRTMHRWKDRNQPVVLPLFPCYLFLRTPLERKIDALQTPGVQWIVENAGYACTVPEEEIEVIRRICSVGTRLQPHPFLKKGDFVRVRKGPLAGTEGFFVQAKNGFRVVVSIELLQKSIAVEVDLIDLEFLNSARRNPLPARAH
jgi:transcription antitermination factor NusG